MTQYAEYERLDTSLAPAYINTNEDLRWITSAIPGSTRVLTVTGSGDQALFYHLNGAKTVDTFDITQFAGLIQDIKTAAIQTLTHDQYNALLQDLSASTNNTEFRIRNMDRIIPLLSPQGKHMLIQPLPFYRFLGGSYNQQSNPTAQEYERLQTTLKTPFKFIHTPLNKLHSHLHGQYNIINISNIFDYCYTPAEKVQIMQTLTPYLTVGGRFLYLPQANSLDFSHVNIINQKTGTQLAYEKTLTNPRDKWSQIICLQRTR